MIIRLSLRPILFLLSLSLLSCATGAVQPQSSPAITRLWSVDVDQRVPGEPSGYSHAAYAVAAKRVIIGGRDARIHVYDMSGHEQWAVAIDEPCDSGALVLQNGLAVVGDVGGTLYAIDPVAGNIVWKHHLGAPFVADPVALNDGFVVQTMDDHLYHFSADGEKRWSFAGAGSGLSLYLTAPPLVLGQSVYAVFSNGDAVALKAVSGDMIWRRQLLLSNEAAVLTELRAPVARPLYLPRIAFGMERADNVLLFAFYQGSIFVLSESDGRQLFTIDRSIKSSPLAEDGRVYIADADGELEAVDLASGATLWKKKVSEGELTGPVAVHGELWLADDRGAVMRIGRDGNNLNTIAVGGRIERSLLVIPEGVLVRSGQGALTLLR